MSDEITITFNDLGLPDTLLASLLAVGYETPTPIQAATIPVLLSGMLTLAHDHDSLDAHWVSPRDQWARL